MAQRRLYVYYRVAVADAEAALAAAARGLAELTAAHPALHCELLRRPAQREGQVTLMEVFAAPQFDAALAQHIEDHMQRHLAPWVDGAGRQVETFEFSASFPGPR